MFILFVMWEDFVLVGQLLAVQAYSAVGWMTKESSISFWQGGVLSSVSIYFLVILFCCNGYGSVQV
jgi:hypothetical protein